jgi:hypothetical protein
LHDRLHARNPDVLLIIGDAQAENFLEDNLPPFCIYTGAAVEGYPFQRAAARVNLWGAPPETKYAFRCPQAFAHALRNALIRRGEPEQGETHAARPAIIRVLYAMHDALI